jgi:hypothetical protein
MGSIMDQERPWEKEQPVNSTGGITLAEWIHSTVRITRKEYESLLDDSRKLGCLEAAVLY